MHEDNFNLTAYAQTQPNIAVRLAYVVGPVMAFAFMCFAAGYSLSSHNREQCANARPLILHRLP